MKNRIIPLIAAAALILGGCENSVGDVNFTEETAISEGSYAAVDGVTISDIKAKYGDNESDGGLVPLYNVAPDEEFDFKFGFDFMEDYDAGEDYVTVHTDKRCLDESRIYVNKDVEETEDGCLITISPMRAVLENNSDEEEYFENDRPVWGNAPVYYIAVRYDTEADSPKKLKKPVIIPFTVKHEVPAPEVRGVVDNQGRFSLQWEPVEGAEEYRVYILTDGDIWTGDNNHPLHAAENGFENLSLLYETSVTDTYFDDFDGGGGNIVVHKDRANGREYVIGQNYCVKGEYYVSAVVDGKESGFARSVPTAELQIPYKPTDESDIMYSRYDDISKLPLSLDIINIDGSVTSRKVMYNFIMSDTYSEGWQVPAYEYSVEGTAISGYVGMDIDDPNFEYPETVGSISSAGFSEPRNNVRSVPDSDIDSEDTDEGDAVYERLKKATEQHVENGDKASSAPLNDGVKIFADSPEEEWLAVNLAGGEKKISLEAFPKLQIYDELEDVFYKVYYQNPYILGVYSFSYDYGDMTLDVEYVYEKDEISAMQREIAEEAEKIISETINDNMTEEERRRAVYSYLESSAEYDDNALEYAKENNYIKTGENEYEYAFNTYGVIVKKTGVCQSYAYAYKLLCSMCGVECSVVTGYMDGSLPHAWNSVTIDGERFQTDVTNNEKNSGIPYFLYNSDIGTAEITGYTYNKLYELDEKTEDYFSDNSEYEYYHVNGLCASSVSEFRNALDGEIDKGGDLICIRYTEGFPEQSEIVKAAAEVYYRKNREEELEDLSLGMGESFIVLFKS